VVSKGQVVGMTGTASRGYTARYMVVCIICILEVIYNINNLQSEPCNCWSLKSYLTHRERRSENSGLIVIPENF